MSVDEGDWDSAAVVIAGSVLVVMNAEVLVGALVVVTGIGAIGNKCTIMQIFSHTDIYMTW